LNSSLPMFHSGQHSRGSARVRRASARVARRDLYRRVGAVNRSGQQSAAKPRHQTRSKTMLRPFQAWKLVREESTGRTALWPSGTVDEPNKLFEQRLLDYAPQAWRSCRRNGCGVWCGRRSRRPPQSAPRASTSGSLRRVYAVETSPDAVQIWHCLCAAPNSETVNPKTSRTPPFSTIDDTMVCPACECWRSRTVWF